MLIDSLIIGPVSQDINIDCRDNEYREIGGAVVAAGYAASGSGFKSAVLTKSSLPDDRVKRVFSDCNVDLYHLKSETTCSIENKYYDETKETRRCTSLSVCEPFTFDDIETVLRQVTPKVLHFAGLVWGDFDENLFVECKDYGKIAVDVQCLLRHVDEDRSMDFHDWKNKKEYLPYIDFLKTDAKEAEILTGTSDRYEAARILHSWGSPEIMITHNTEVIVYNGVKFYSCPIKTRRLVGRTGRGDTTFSGYINSRSYCGTGESLLYATALVSLKMEKAGPFKGTRKDVLSYIDEFYCKEKSELIDNG